ncbi:hypothetical protein BVRB_040740, partial [Beta vulgaris subsp. vulgaris]
QPAVKVHGVFPSDRGYVASSPRLQFHRVSRGDSAPVVTPFMQVGTYPTRNFATLGPYSYGRRSPGLRSPASLALIGSLNLPTPSRRQTLYVLLRVGRVLCF